MDEYDFATVDVFTDRRFGGNPLAVFPDARGLSTAQMQNLAAELNLSETTFVLPPDDPAHTARVRIFNTREEMPFAGHPNVGTAFVLARSGRAQGDVLLFEELAGLVEVTLERNAAGEVAGATVKAPRVLEIGTEVPAEDIATCVGLSAKDVITSHMAPIFVSMGYPFLMAEVTPEALARAAPDHEQFRRIRDARAGPDGRLSLHLRAAGAKRVRARMFAPLVGMPEDPATGAAAACLVGLMLSRTSAETLAIELSQGAEMGRPSLIRASATRTRQGISAAVGGSCVPVLRGKALA